MSLSILLAFAAAQSTSAAPTPAVPAHRWTLDYSRSACTIARRVGDDGSAIMAVNAPLGHEPGELVFMDGGSGLDQRLTGEVRVRLDDGEPIVLRARRPEQSARPLMRLRPLPDDFLDRMTRARQITVSKGAETLYSVPLGQVHEAVAGLGRCNDDLMQSWGVDTAARRSLRRPPRVVGYSWMLEMMPNATASVVVVANVSEGGGAEDCRVVVSSGNERFDRMLCNRIDNRARFEPALDAAGRPVAAQYVSRFSWYVDE